jgi:hypothetical protein
LHGSFQKVLALEPGRAGILHAISTPDAQQPAATLRHIACRKAIAVHTQEATMSDVRDTRLTVAVDLMAEPCLWRWEIRDRTRGKVVADSWTHDWMAYDSSDEALRAGQDRLTSLDDR